MRLPHPSRISSRGSRPRPVLPIYSDHDNPGETALTPAYYEAAGQPKALWKVPSAGQTGGIEARPREYEQRVVGFFDEALLGIDRTDVGDTTIP